MKNKMLLPVVAVLFGVVTAFSSVDPSPQIAWFKSGTIVDDAAIDFPAEVDEDNRCTTAEGVQCTINGLNAYDSEIHAEDAPSTVGLLKYSN